jgi:hypothetical protein
MTMRIVNLAFGAAALLCLALSAALVARPSPAAYQAQFQIVAQANSDNVWQLNTATGELRLCSPGHPSVDGGPPDCYPATPWIGP